MAAILRSSVIKTARHAFSGGGTTLSVRALHTGRKVDPSFNKIDDVARKGLVDRCTERLAKELKSSTPSPLGTALQGLVSIAAVGAYMLGCQFGLANKCRRQASSKKEA